MILDKKLALAKLFVSTLLCFGCASEVEPVYLPISTNTSDERSESERREEIDDRLRNKAAQYCNIDELENTAAKVIAVILPEKNLSGRFKFYYDVSSYSIDMSIYEVRENGEKNPLRVASFSLQDCSMMSLLVLTH